MGDNVLHYSNGKIIGKLRKTYPKRKKTCLCNYAEMHIIYIGCKPNSIEWPYHSTKLKKMQNLSITILSGKDLAAMFHFFFFFFFLFGRIYS